MKRHISNTNITLQQNAQNSVPQIPAKGYGIPKNRPIARRPEKPDDLPIEVTEWLNVITNREPQSKKY